MFVVELLESRQEMLVQDPQRLLVVGAESFYSTTFEDVRSQSVLDDILTPQKVQKYFLYQLAEEGKYRRVSLEKQSGREFSVIEAITVQEKPYAASVARVTARVFVGNDSKIA